MPTRNAAFLLIFALLLGCSAESPESTDLGEPTPVASPIECDPDNGGIELPEGFCALVYADELGRGRHLTVTSDGDVYVALREGENGGVVALRDTDGDGRADERAQFGDHYGTGIEVHDGHLYFGTNTSILRYELTPGMRWSTLMTRPA